MAVRAGHADSQAGPNPIRVRFDAFELDEANASLLRNGMPVALPPTPFAVLCTLVRKRGSLLSTNALLDEVWGHQFVSDSVLRTAISELRTALDDDAKQAAVHRDGLATWLSFHCRRERHKCFSTRFAQRFDHRVD